MWELPHACTADTTASPFGKLLSKIFDRINVCSHHRLTFGFYGNFTRVLIYEDLLKNRHLCSNRLQWSSDESSTCVIGHTKLAEAFSY